MPPLSQRDQRTLRLALAGIVIYLCVFYGAEGIAKLEKQRKDYHALLDRAQNLKREFEPFRTKVELMEKLKGNFRLDLASLKPDTLIADTSATIQRVALAQGIELGPLREASPRVGSRELTSIQLEGTGKVPAILSLLHQLTTLGYPVLLDQVQLTPQTSQPGLLKFNLTLVILDWKQILKEGARNV